MGERFQWLNGGGRKSVGLESATWPFVALARLLVAQTMNEIHIFQYYTLGL